MKNWKKNNSENVSTPKVGVLNVEFALNFRIYRSLKSFTCLKWIRKKFSTILHTQFSYLTYPVTPFKAYVETVMKGLSTYFQVPFLKWHVRFTRRKYLKSLNDEYLFYTPGISAGWQTLFHSWTNIRFQMKLRNRGKKNKKKCSFQGVCRQYLIKEY